MEVSIDQKYNSIIKTLHENPSLQTFAHGITLNCKPDISISNQELSFNFIGCWNSMCHVASRGDHKGLMGQPYISLLMKEFNQTLNPQFTILLGDNIYDTKIKKGDSKDNIYIDPNNNFNYGIACFDLPHTHKLFALLGNHDVDKIDLLKYELNKTTFDNQIISSQWILPTNYYNFIVDMDSYKINFIQLDTNMFVKEEYSNIVDNDTINDLAIRQLQWLTKILEINNDKINIISGHHPIFAIGHKEKNPLITNHDMLQIYKILLEHNVKFYICADEHNFQYLYDANNDFHFLVVGGVPRSGGDITYSLDAYQHKDFSNKNIHFEFKDGNETYDISSELIIQSPTYVNFKITNNKIKFNVITLNNIQPFNKIFQSYQDSNMKYIGGQLIYEKIVLRYNNYIYIQNLQNFTTCLKEKDNKVCSTIQHIDDPNLIYPRDNPLITKYKNTTDIQYVQKQTAGSKIKTYTIRWNNVMK